MIRIHPLLAAALLLAAIPAAAQQPSAAWRSDVSCTAGRNPALVLADTPSAARLQGCARAWCIALPGGRRVCSCANDDAATLRLEAAGRTVQQWPAELTFVSPYWFRVLHGDLDADGQAELVVAQLRAASNGLGVHDWEITILDGRDPARPPVRLQVEDFGEHGSFVRPAAGGSCRLLATRWADFDDPRRGVGSYLVGQWMRYRGGRMEHDPTRPVVARRLLDSFAEARFEIPDEPWGHLRHRNAEVRSGSPVGKLPPPAGRAGGTVRRVRGDTVEVLLRSGVVERYTLGTVHESSSQWSITRTALVDGATGRPYPAGYRPADPRWLEGAAVTVAIYRERPETVLLLIVGEVRR